jgi:hypothetical protein
MPERRVPTLADAQRQVWWRGGSGWLLIGLSLIFLLLFLVKHVYVNLSYSPFSAAWGAKLRNSIDSLLEDWAVLDLLWRASPPWQPMATLSTTPLWDYVYVMWLAMVVIAVGGLLLRSAYARHAQITEFRQEMQREAWRQQARRAQGLDPDDRGTTTLFRQTTWHQYPAPLESWSHTTLGSLTIALVGHRWDHRALRRILVLSSSLALQPQLRNAHAARRRGPLHRSIEGRKMPTYYYRTRCGTGGVGSLPNE